MVFPIYFKSFYLAGFAQSSIHGQMRLTVLSLLRLCVSECDVGNDANRSVNWVIVLFLVNESGTYLLRIELYGIIKMDEEQI